MLLNYICRLCSVGSRRSSVIEPKVEDLDAWLHAETPETEESNFENGMFIILLKYKICHL